MSRKNKLLVHMERDRDGRTPGYFLLKYESKHTIVKQDYRREMIKYCQQLHRFTLSTEVIPEALFFVTSLHIMH